MRATSRCHSVRSTGVLDRFFSGLKPARLGPLGFVRPDQLALGAIGLAVVLIAGTIALIFLTPSSPSPRLDAANIHSVHLDEPVAVRFSPAADTSHIGVTITPTAKFTVTRLKNELVLQPAPAWLSDKNYTVKLGDVPDVKHRAIRHGFSGVFHTQPLVGVAAWTVNGKPAGGQLISPLHPQLVANFSTEMKASSVQFMVDAKPLPSTAVKWDSSATDATLTLPNLLQPYHKTVLQVPQTGVSKTGNPMTGPSTLSLSTMGIEPANATSGIGPGFKTLNPVMIIVENAPAARPQIGLQSADMVFEYLSEYGITRFTAMYFNKMAAVVRPVRSCRIINLYLDFGFRGLHMCSGTSAGTYLWFMGNHNTPVAPGAINDVDPHGYFYRCGGDAPHNLCVGASGAYSLRRNWRLPSPTYFVDPPHPDIAPEGPSGPPSIAQHCVSYRYDRGSKTYLRFDHGTPFTDGQTGRQLHVKNVVEITVNEHYGGWVEDENGGAGSIWYEMLGAGPADIYTDGGVTHAIWHFGDDLKVAKLGYWLNSEGMWFSDRSGNPLELNTGLTWVHVIGRQNLNAGC